MLFPRKQLNNPSDITPEQSLKKAKRNLYLQAGMAVFTVAAVLLLIFARTAAWYTNVVSTGGLTFQAETWGFEGGAVVSEDAVPASPGDEGIIELKITNTGKLASTVSVNISKEYMQDVQMQQRIYFYADRQLELNGETVQRQYLNNTGGYSYFLPGQNELILSEQVNTDVQLKWEWVFDVVGYYFRGTQDGTAFTVEEYLRPIEYSCENAIYDETTGQLLKVDAKTDAAAFLAALTAADGYPGAFTVETDANTGAPVLKRDGQTVNTTLGCYPVDEENNIWLYLCTKQDIQRNTVWDTQFGMNAQVEQRTFQVRIAVTGQQMQQQTVSVTDYGTLQTALNANSGDLITLDQDLILTKPLTMNKGTQSMLNLNGHHITSSANVVFDVPSGAALTIMDGSISGQDDKTVVFQSVGGSITMSNLQITNVYNALCIADYTTTNDQGDNSIVRITGCEMHTADVAVMISGDGSASERKTALVIQDSTIDSQYVAVLGNGTATNPGRWGTDIQIVNSVVTGLYAGVYQPQMTSTLTVSGSTVSGWTGIAVKGGSVVVLDSVITGIGENSEVTVPTQDNVSKSGFVDTGDGIYAESVYDYPITITVSGSSEIRCTAQTARAVRVFPESMLVSLYLTSGTYDTDVSEFLQAGYTCSKADDGYIVSPK